MKKTASIIVFAVLAVGIILLAMWYNGQTDQAAQVSESNAVAEQQQQQTQAMQNLKINDVTVGTGAEAKNGAMVTVNYVGTLDDGTKFDSSYDRKQPFSFLLGAGQVIRGWDLGVLGMKVGGKRELTIPPELGYGVQGVPNQQTGGYVIPPSATLHFTVELLSVGSSTAAGSASQ